MWVYYVSHSASVVLLLLLQLFQIDCDGEIALDGVYIGILHIPSMQQVRGLKVIVRVAS